MSLKAKRKAASSIPPMDGGTYMAVCVAVIDLGEQYKQFEKQKQGKYAEECMFIFEIPSFAARAQRTLPDADLVARQGADGCGA